MPKMQEEVDEWKFLGQHGTRMYQMPYQCLPTQAGVYKELLTPSGIIPFQRLNQYRCSSLYDGSTYAILTFTMVQQRCTFNSHQMLNFDLFLG